MTEKTYLKRDSKSSSEQNIKMLTPGQILKTYRERQNLTLEEISEKTKIPLDQLEKIETDDFSKKETHVFMRGFIKNYSDFLGLNTERVLAIYRRTIATYQDKKTNVFSTTRKNIIDYLIGLKKNFQLTPKTIIFSAIFLSIGFVIIYFIIQIINFQSPPKLELLSPTDNLVLDTDTVEVKGKVELISVVKINNEVIQIDQDGNFSSKIKLVEGTNVIIVKAYKNNNEKRSTVITRSILYEKVGSDEEIEEEAEIIESTPSTVRITINGEDTWITLNIDGQQVIAWILGNGADETNQFSNSFSLVTGKPETTKVYVDGKEEPININYQTGSSTLNCTKENNKIMCK